MAHYCFTCLEYHGDLEHAPQAFFDAITPPPSNTEDRGTG